MEADDGAWATVEDRFGRNLRRIREELDVSQGELAQRLQGHGIKLHPSAIAKIEARGADSATQPRTVRLNEADAIARALGRPLEDFLAGPDKQFAEAAIWVNHATQQLKNAIRMRDKAFGALRELKAFDDFDPSDVSPAIQADRAQIIKDLAEMETVIRDELVGSTSTGSATVNPVTITGGELRLAEEDEAGTDAT